MSCGCSKPSGGLTDYKIMGGRRRKTAKKTKKSKNTKKAKKMKKTKHRKKRAGRRKRTVRRVMKGGMNSDLIGDTTTNVTHFTSKLLGTPFTPNTIQDQPANQSYGKGNLYLV